MRREKMETGAGAVNENVPVKKKKGKLIAGIVIILFLALVGYRIVDNYVFTEEEEEASAVNVKVATAQTGNIYVESPITAKIEAVDEVAVVPVVAGKVSSVNVKEGDYVKKGEVLFKIDSTQVESSLIQAKSAVNQADSACQQMSESLNLAKTGLDTAKNALDRTEYLYSEGVVSLQEYEGVQTQYNTAKSQYSNLQIQYESAKNQKATAAQSYETAKKSLSYYTVTAPISGYLTTFSVNVGGVAGQSPAAYIADTSELIINCTVSEKLAQKINEGDCVDVYISALQKNIDGRVKTFTKIPKTGTVTYPLVISIDNDDNDLLAGMFAEVKIKSQESSQTIVVPSEAVIVKNGQPSVVTLTGKMPIINKVETGIDNGEQVEIISGIKEGATIVVSGQQYVKEGEEVNVVE